MSLAPKPSHVILAADFLGIGRKIAVTVVAKPCGDEVAVSASANIAYREIVLPLSEAEALARHLLDACLQVRERRLKRA